MLLHAIVFIAILFSKHETSPGSIGEPIVVDLISASEPATAERRDRHRAQTVLNVPAIEDAELAGPAIKAGLAVANSDEHPAVATGDREKSAPADRATVVRDRVQRKKRQTQALAVAVYNVLVDDAGNIRDVILMRSSGIASFDEAGKEMIYNGIALLPPRRETSALTVTVHFSRERR